MMERVFSLLRKNNPNLAAGRKRHTMIPPQLVHVGTRKTMWGNFKPICDIMHRTQEHVMSFVLSELGTDGSLDAKNRFLLKGRFRPVQVESLLKKYVVEYVMCAMCRNWETSLIRDPDTRLHFIQCESCGSRRSLPPIKSGFHATSRSDRRKVKALA
jgi:translation initiation factor 2 subunit 2